MGFEEYVNWIESYLSNRYQYVSLNNVVSDKLLITCGVPQGSILGPLFFIIFVNDICNVSSLLRLILFADDTNIFMSGNNTLDLCNRMTVELKKISTWLNVNKLTLNISKTDFIIFGKGCQNANLNITINSADIERVYSTKFLGIHIDHKLNWKVHINYISNKLSKSIAIISKARSVLDTNSLRILYNSLFLPYFSYCIEVCEIHIKVTLNVYHCYKRK